MDIHIQRDGQQMSYTLEQVNEHLAQGSLLATDYAWHEGLPQWVPLNEIAGVASNQAVASVPPTFNPAAATPLEKGGGKKKLLLFGGIGVGVAALIAVALVIVLGGEKEEAQPTTPETTTKKPEPPKATANKNEVVAWVSDPSNPQNVIVEDAIRRELEKPTGEFTKSDLEKVKELYMPHDEIANLESLAGLTNLEQLFLWNNQITNLTPLAGLKGLKQLIIYDNPNLTKTEIDKLQQALPKCEIIHNAKK